MYRRNQSNRGFGSRRRGTYRRGGRRRSGNIYKRKVQQVRNRPYLKPRRSGFGNIASNITRRLVAYPATGNTSSWWLDSLKWLSSVALQLIGMTITMGDDDSDVGVTKFCVIGAATRILIDSGFILQASPLAVPANEKTIKIPFEQYRIMWIRILVNPIVDVSKRGGSYACALVPLDGQGNEVDTNFDCVIRQPGSIVRPIDKPCSVSWSPSILEYGLRWHDINNTLDKPVCAFVISFSDLALNQPDGGGTTSNEYTPQKAGFELFVESRVEVRRSGIVERSVKLKYSDPSVIKIYDYNRCYEVLSNSVTWDNGVGSCKNTDLIDIMDGSIIDEEDCH